MENPLRRRALVAGLAGSALTLVGQRASATPPDGPSDTSGSGDSVSEADGQSTGAETGTPGTDATVPTTDTALSDATVPTSDSTADSTTSTTLQPVGPTEDDKALLGDAQRLELAAVELYAAALAAGAAGDEDRVLQTLRDNHQTYADTFSALLGTIAPNEASQALLDEWGGRFETASLADVAGAGFELESSFAQTYVDLAGQLQSTDGLVATGSMLTVTSRACVVLADLNGQGDDLDAVLNTDAAALEA